MRVDMSALQPANPIDISANIAGRVVEVDVKEGQHVQQGQVLFRLDPRPFVIALNNAKADLAQAVLDTNSLKASYQASLGQINFERGLIFDTALLAVEYALSGEGLALVDVNLFAEELRCGRLVRPFDISLDDGYGYYLITQPEALSDTAIALFRSWMIEHFGPRTPAEESAVRLAVSND